jgi:hypothetical protein
VWRLPQALPVQKFHQAWRRAAEQEESQREEEEAEDESTEGTEEAEQSGRDATSGDLAEVTRGAPPQVHEVANAGPSPSK